MNELNVALFVYGLLQIGSLALLPRWWKLAVLPSLYVIGPIIDYFRTGGGYMGDVFVIMFCIYACAYLGAVWAVWGLTKLAKRLLQSLRRSIADESIRGWLGRVPARIWQWCQRRPVAAVCAATVLLALILLVGVVVATFARPPRLAANGTDGSFTMNGYRTQVMSLAFSPDGRQCVTVGRDRRITVWNTSDWTILLRIRAHSDTISAVAFSPDGTRLATGSWDETIRLWDAASGNLLYTFRRQLHMVDAVTFDVSGKLLAAVLRSGEVIMWDADSKRELVRRRGARLVLFTPDGRYVASRPKYNQLTVWDTATGDESFTILYNLDSAGIADDPAVDEITGAAFCPQGKLLAIGCRDSTIKFYDAVTGQHRMTLEGHSDRVLSVAFSSDGKQLASSSLDGSVRLWDTDTGNETATYYADVISLAFSSDAKQLAGANRLNGSFTLWKLTMASQSEVIAQ